MGDRLISPLLTFIVPHHIDIPFLFSLSLLKLYQHSSRAVLADMDLPDVELVPRTFCTWQRDVVAMGPPTEMQAAVTCWLRQSWERESDKEEMWVAC